MHNIEQIKESIKQNINLFIEQDMNNEANMLLEQLQKIAPNDTIIYSMRAKVSLKEGKLKEAKQLLQIGMRINFKNPELLFQFAQLMEREREWEEASFYYRKAAEYTNDSLLQECISHSLIHVNEHIKKASNKKLVSNTHSPKVSVIVASYNMKGYLQETVDSILRQDYKNIEIIVSDDCSTDGTDEMMKLYKNNSKVRYIRNSINLGAKENSRKLLYELAQGTYILGINHDDYLTQDDYISKAVTLLEENPNVSLVFANLKILHTSSGKISYTNVDIPKITNGIDYFLHYETERYPHITSVLTSMYRRKDALKRKCFLEETECQDLFLYLNMMLIGDIAFIPDYVGVYRIHENSISANMPMETDLSTITELEKLYDEAIHMDLDKAKLQQWLTNRVYAFIQWRFLSIWSKDRYSALQLLSSVFEIYPEVYHAIANRLHWKD
ncbi:hypothetical protein BAMA_14680 [Bacillus manliponensis]|uniref:Glycosyltransferase 2-like domain-containing protein n=1 Tax=Bacillus manliponensis TaxID=574376 RepID=A0A073K2G3_9BACI|nr:glycosyltransferase [Bacillus manliponensis]KEK20652.1 hypothetical protein BAMA_14680 [Bacillus manliponensis]